MKVTLNEQEVRLAKFIARERSKFNRDNGVTDAKVCNEKSEKIEEEGMGGEIAFCKIFNIYPDLRVENVNTSNDNGDCEYKGHRVDVKTTSYRNGMLITVPWKKDTVDYYALMVGEMPTYEFKGFAKSSDLKNKNKLRHLGYNEVYCMEQNELNKTI